jgi:hypothetical protein
VLPNERADRSLKRQLMSLLFEEADEGGHRLEHLAMLISGGAISFI